ncbi:DsrE family protein [Sediminibacterium soli]|uniref:DsrE family protein n=1 Tax=Sediminibacterium soli TaxID=2698829 RepID=UPI00137B1587|nr:DsrE family protein [Sediminibacterium soli]NCI46621.1 DsrE family protein [Sediminibacterium soli]
MKKILFLGNLLLLGLFAGAQQGKLNPVIKQYGAVNPIPYAVEKPDPKIDYKVVVEVNTDNPKPELVHELLEKTASVVNLHALGGVPANKLHVVLVVHGPAAQYVVNNAAYQKKFNTDNPNLGLFRELQEAGVKLFVCGQSLVKRNIDPATVSPDVKVALSAITTLTTYQAKGYSLLKF